MQHQPKETNQGEFRVGHFSFANLPGCRLLLAAGGRCPASRRALLFKHVHSSFSKHHGVGTQRRVTITLREKAVPPVDILVISAGLVVAVAWVGGSPLRGYCCLDKPALPIDLSGLQRVKS